MSLTMLFPRKKIAVIGSGVSGLVSAYRLSKDYHVDVYEAEPRLGGHTHTVQTKDTVGKQLAIDTGFIVFTKENYPEFMEFLTEMGVLYQKSDMSFSVYCEKPEFYFGSDFPNGVFAQKRNKINPGFYHFLWGIHRFNKQCLSAFKKGLSETQSLGSFLEEKRVPHSVIVNYVMPMTSAIWSASFEDTLKFPAKSFIQFWKNHQLLDIGKGYQWHTITNGSVQYIHRVLPHISGQVFTNTPVQKVDVQVNCVRIHIQDAYQDYDGVVIATHADTALKLRETPTDLEEKLLGAWHYSLNKAVLHTDERHMPPSKAAWCSWNLIKPQHASFQNPVTVSYWMNRLQKLQTEQNFFLTLNPAFEISPQSLIKEMRYAHPVMTHEAMATQKTLPMLNKNSRIVYAGSYFGYGFHEDAVRSANAAFKALDCTLRSGEHA